MPSFDVTTSGNKAHWKVLPLDPSLYQVQDDEREFFKDQTNIAGDEELEQHVLEIQHQAYAVSGVFLHASISTIPVIYSSPGRPLPMHPCIFFHEVRTYLNYPTLSQHRPVGLMLHVPLGTNRL